MSQIIGPLSRLILIKEDTGSALGSDPASPIKRIAPLQAVDAFKTDQLRTAAKIFDGTRDPKGSTKGMITAAGSLPMSLDFRFVGLPLDVFYGHGVYSRVGSLHSWVGEDNTNGPGAMQIQREYLQASIYHRDRGIRIGSFDFKQAMSGQAMYTLNTLMGKGDFLLTDVGGSVVNDGPFVASNYFDGALFKDGVDTKGKVTVFDVTENNTLSRQDAAFSGGQAAGINAGILLVTGNLGLIYSTEDGDAFLNEALEDTLGSVECVWFNAPISANPTMYLRKIYPAVLFGRGTVNAGGEAGIALSQTWVAQKLAGYLAAELIFGNCGTYPINSGDTVPVKIDGSGVITVPLTDGPARTTDQIVADFAAYSGFTDVAVCDNWYGRPRIKSKSSASTSAVQIDSSIDPDLQASLGLDVTARAAIPSTAVATFLQNDLAVDY